jgi:hypothetical protein
MEIKYQFNQKLCNIMRKKLGYALSLKIACPGQITHQKFPLQDLTTAYKTVSQNFDIIKSNLSETHRYQDI